MKKAVALVAVVLTLGMGLALDAEAKRLGGGKSTGMQRQAVTAPANNTPGAPHAPSQAAPAAGTAAAAGAPAAAAAKRSWMGPVAGLAAGLGLAALASHFGFGEALANVMTMALIAMGVLLLVGFFLRRKAQAQGQGPALAGAGARGTTFQQETRRAGPEGGSLIGSRLGGGGTAAGPIGTVPAGFDSEAFVRNAKVQFLSLQAANDSGDLNRLREYLTPEMFDIVRDEIAQRAGAQQATEVFGLQAQVLEVVEERDRYIASVRFTGSIREQAGAVPEDLDETWHLAKPRHGDGGWVIAGIQQA